MSMQDLINLKSTLSGLTFGPLIFDFLVDEIEVNHNKIDELDTKIDELEARVEALEP